jgi:uncharacterized protein YbjT (DUF2867 family)
MSEFVLVTGATGQQGGAVARALVGAGTPVHALVRDPDAGRARALAELGVQLVRGDLDEPASLKSALDGARGLFSVQMPDLANLRGDTELRRARNLAAAAAAAGVRQVVHTSASGVTRLVDESRWGSSLAHVFRTKTSAEEAIREIAARSTTILRPSLFMENFLPPSYFYAPGSSDRLLLAYDPDVPQAFVAVADIAAAAAAAFADPVRFDGVELELAGDRRSLREAVAVVSDAWGTTLTLPASPAAAIADGLAEAFVQSQTYLSICPAPARPELAHAFGVPTTTIEEWARTVR